LLISLDIGSRIALLVIYTLVGIVFNLTTKIRDRLARRLYKSLC
jgi:hypothetical protein